MVDRKYTGYIANPPQYVQEEFKGVVIDKEIRFPKELGAMHPFDFHSLEKAWKKIGLVNGIVNKIKNSIVGDFSVKVEDENIQAFLNDFIDDTNFASVLREWIKEGLLKGNGFIELDLDNNNLRVLNANNMYVRRTRKGKVLGYNQWLGQTFRNFSKESKLITPFKPNQIAHLKVNKISNDPYAYGIIWPNERVIENMVQMEQDLHKLTKRKAGAPIHVKVGVPGESVNVQDIDDYANKLKFMNTRTEWVTDANTEMKVLDFANLTANLTDTLEYDLQLLATSVNVPRVLLGKANVPEGLAKVQGENFQRFIKSVREEIETIIEDKIFKPLLLANKFPSTETDKSEQSKKAVGSSIKVEFIWNLPGEEEINMRIEKLTGLLANFNISENMKRMIQLELAKLLDFKDAENFLLEPEAGIDQIDKQMDDEFRKASLDTARETDVDKLKGPNSPEAKKEKKIKQPEVPGAKPSANSKLIKKEGKSLDLKSKTNEGDTEESIFKGVKHQHGFEIDELGTGRTKDIFWVPLDYPYHEHKIKNKIVQLFEGHTHKIKKTVKAKLIHNKHMPGCGCGQQLTEKESSLMTIKEWVSLKELAGFNYSDYLIRILKRLRIDKFDQLRAVTEGDIADGLLNTSQTNKLRFILKEGFKNNRTIAEIETEIKTSLNLKDRLKEGKLVSKAENRPTSISRTETVRLANLGLLDTYKDNKIEMVRFLAALSERTCPECEGLNGQVFLLNEAEDLIPVHTMCRCTWESIL